MRSDLDDKKDIGNLLNCLGCSYPLKPQAANSKSNNDTEYDKWHIEVIPNCEICSECITKKKVYENEKRDKEVSLLEEAIRNINENTIEEKQKEVSNKALMKKREIIVASHNEKIKKIQEEKEAIAKEIISELEDINKINDELVEIEFEDFESNQDIYKYLNEINILNLEIAEIEGFNPIQEAFSIELKETYGIIRQYPLKFFLKSDHLVLLT